MPPLPRHKADIEQGDAADGGAYQAQAGVAGFGGHAAYLSVFAFADFDFQPKVGHGLAHTYWRLAWPQMGGFVRGHYPHFGWLADKIAQIHAAFEYSQFGFVRLAFHLRPIGFFGFEFRAGYLCLQAAVVGEQQQAFAVGIEPAGRVEAGSFDIVFQAAVFFMRAKLADNAVGLVE